MVHVGEQCFSLQTFRCLQHLGVWPSRSKKNIGDCLLQSQSSGPAGFVINYSYIYKYSEQAQIGIRTWNLLYSNKKYILDHCWATCKCFKKYPKSCSHNWICCSSSGGGVEESCDFLLYKGACSLHTLFYKHITISKSTELLVNKLYKDCLFHLLLWGKRCFGFCFVFVFCRTTGNKFSSTRGKGPPCLAHPCPKQHESVCKWAEAWIQV